MKLLVQKVKNGNFKGDDGEQIEYYWVTALREGDGVTIQFGTRNEYEVNEKIDIDIQKSEYLDPKGRIQYRYKEITE